MFMDEGSSPTETHSTEPSTPIPTGANVVCNDDKRADAFFDAVLEQYCVKQPIENLAFITVSHLLPTLTYSHNALSKIGRIAAVVPKSSSYTQAAHSQYSHAGYPIQHIGEINKDTLNVPETLLTFLQSVVMDHEKLIILDCGGYFAEGLALLKNNEWVREHIIGCVEQTKNGDIRYRQVLESTTSLPFKFISNAKIDIKWGEDYNVGDGLVQATDTILRTDANTKTNRCKCIGIIGLGDVGLSIAAHLRQKQVKRILLCDKDPTIAFKATSQGYELASLETLLTESDCIYAAAGVPMLNFSKVRDNVFISTVTSASDSFAPDAFDNYDATPTENGQITQLREKITGKTVNLINHGNAANFRFNAVDGASIYAVLVALQISAVLMHREPEKLEHGKLHAMGKQDMDNIAAISLRVFENQEQPNLPTLKALEDLPAVNTDPRFIKSPTPRLHYVPEVSEHFYGRASLLADIKTFLSPNNKPIRPLVFSGMGGLGKTELLLKYAWDQQTPFPGGCLFLPCETLGALLEALLSIAEHLDFSREEAQSLAANKLLFNILTRMMKQGRVLLLFDDVPSQDFIDPFLPPSRIGFNASNVAILASSLNQTSWRWTQRTLDITEKMFHEDGLGYVCQSLKVSAEEAQPLLVALDDLPLALSQAVCFIQANKITIQTYLSLLDEAPNTRKELLSEPSRENGGAATAEQRKHYKACVLRTFDLSIAKIQEDTPLAGDVMNCSAWLYPDNIDIKLFKKKFQDISTIGLLKLKTALRQYSLISPVGEWHFRVHRLLQEAIRDKQTAEQQLSVVTDAIALIEDNYGSDDYNDLSDIMTADMHYQALCRSMTSPEEIKTLKHTSLLFKLGLYYLNAKKEVVHAENHFQRALTIITTLPSSPDERDLYGKIKLQLLGTAKRQGKSAVYQQLLSELHEDQSLTHECRINLLLTETRDVFFDKKSRTTSWDEWHALRKTHADRLIALLNSPIEDKYKGNAHLNLGYYYRSQAKLARNYLNKGDSPAKRETFNVSVQEAIASFESALSFKKTAKDNVLIMKCLIDIRELIYTFGIEDEKVSITRRLLDAYQENLLKLSRTQHHVLYYKVATALLNIIGSDIKQLFRVELLEPIQNILYSERTQIKLQYGEQSEQYIAFLDKYTAFKTAVRSEINITPMTMFKPSNKRRSSSTASSSQGVQSFDSTTYEEERATPPEGHESKRPRYNT